MADKTFTIEGMHCTSCAMLIEGELEDIGVQAKVNYPKQSVKVTFDENKCSVEDIKAAIRKAGYSAKEAD